MRQLTRSWQWSYFDHSLGLQVPSSRSYDACLGEVSSLAPFAESCEFRIEFSLVLQNQLVRGLDACNYGTERFVAPYQMKHYLNTI